MNKLLRRLPRWFRRLFGIYGVGRGTPYNVDNMGLTVDTSKGVLTYDHLGRCLDRLPEGQPYIPWNNGDGTYTYTFKYPGVKDGDITHMTPLNPEDIARDE